MKKTFLTFFSLLFIGQLIAQKFSVTGTVIDSAGKAMESASVVLLNSSDSSLVNFARTKADGTFLMRNVAAGTAYTIRITFVGYDAFLQDIPKDFKGEKFDASAIRMTPLSKMLDAALVTSQRAPVTFNGDTTVFNADAFKTQPNATAEDLLKKLPGVEVDKDGNVKAQGEAVTNILVNGKKFFGTDPKIATQNLPAGAVKNVKVYDKKSDQAEFSGVDDGSREKTIDFQLREEYNQGTFGNITGGGGVSQGNDARYYLKGGFNRFTKKQQLSILGTGNNINKAGFGFEDYMSYTGGTQRLAAAQAGGGAVNIQIGGRGGDSPVPLDNGRNSGFINTWAGGLNLNNQLSAKTELNGNYFYNNSNRLNESVVNRQNFLPNRTYSTNSKSLQNSLNDNHRLGITLEHKIDSFNALRLTSNFSITQNKSTSTAKTETLNAENVFENTSDRTTNTEGEGMNMTNNLLWRHRFAKKGRNFTSNFTFNKSNNYRESDISARNEFLNPFGGTKKDTSLQKDIRDNDRQSYGTSLTFTEPIARRMYLEFMYSYQKTDNDADRRLDTILNGERYNNPNLSNLFNNDFSYHRAGVNYRYTNKELTFTTGMQYQESILRGLIVNKNSEVSRTYKRVLPNLRANYRFNMTESVNLDYDASIREPNVDQLQPIIDNTDPLNISLGNPDLKPESNHRVMLRYNRFNQANMHGLFANMSVNYTLDKIANSQSVDARFIRTSKPINTKDAVMLNGFVGYTMPVATNWRFFYNLSQTYSSNVTFINNQENITKNNNTRLNTNISYRSRDTFEVTLGARVGLNNAKYSVQTSLNRKYYNHEYEATLGYTLPWNTRFNTDFNYVFYTGQTFGANQSIPIWNASFSKFFLKNKRGEFKLAVYDILNRNTGFNRTADANYIQDEIVRSLGRYAMLTFTYAINPMLGGPGGSRGGMRMIMRGM
jgi:hypothetical protein